MEISITGKTRVLGIIGCPVEHSLSPLMHNAALAAALIDFVPLAVMPEHLPDAVAGLLALNVTAFAVGEQSLHLRQGLCSGRDDTACAGSPTGLKCANGAGMLVAQKEEAFRTWTGAPPPAGIMARQLRSLSRSHNSTHQGLSCK